MLALIREFKAVIFIIQAILKIKSLISGYFSQQAARGPGNPATPFQAKAVADMKQAVKAPSRPMDASETEIIMHGNDMQADRLTQ